ncbi:MAG: methyltransferase domain-containing protein [Polynucleobacter sp.]|nr:methyltransferase domain-containing protein [Polynucleobacter sp.]MDZ4058085.1 methyltransferase domain-containing protein [Polynucleobacter sp.]
MTEAAGLNAHQAIANPSPWVVRFAPWIKTGGAVLDIAAGSGRHSLFLAQQGFTVLAIDRDAEALGLLKGAAGNLPITTHEQDLEGVNWPLLPDRLGLVDAIVVTNYLYRPYLDALPALLAEGGILLYETFAHGNAEIGKPSNPDFLLQKGELLNFALRHDLTVLAYEDLYQPQPKPAMIQRLCAVKGEPKERHPLQFKG